MSDFTDTEEQFIQASVEVFETGRQIGDLYKQQRAAEERSAAAQEALGLTNLPRGIERDTAVSRVDTLLREAARRAGIEESVVNEAIGLSNQIFEALDNMSQSDLERLAAEFGAPTV